MLISKEKEVVFRAGTCCAAKLPLHACFEVKSSQSALITQTEIPPKMNFQFFKLTQINSKVLFTYKIVSKIALVYLFVNFQRELCARAM